MARERAFGALQIVKDIRWELKVSRSFMESAERSDDHEKFSVALKCAQSTRDQWFRLVGYPLPCKLTNGERPLDALLNNGAFKYSLESAIIQEVEATNEEVNLVPA